MCEFVAPTGLSSALCVIQIRPPIRINMRHDIQHAVMTHDPISCFDRDVVAGLDADAAVDLDMRIDHNHVAHLARAQIVHAVDAACGKQGLAYRIDFARVDGVIDQRL